MSRTTIAIAWISLQFVFLAGMAISEAQRLMPGRGDSILVRTAPVDPRDLLRGQYMRLQYPFSRIPSGLSPQPNDTVWVVLRPESDNGQVFHEPVDYSLTRPLNTQPNDVVIRGEERDYRIRYGIEKYFVPFGTETPNRNDITVRLRVGADHRPRIEQVYVKGQAWPSR